MKIDAFGNRMKIYESFETSRKARPLLPLIARLDGKKFSGFTRKLGRPYDKRLIDLMIRVTKYLVTETNARMGYTQSDEITLAWYSSSLKSQIYFHGKLFKMISVLAATASVQFNKFLPDYIPEKVSYNPAPVFDCRVWEVPTLTEGANSFLWRELDATRNSILSAGYSKISHKKMHGKNTSEVQEMLYQRGINWNDYPAFFKRGTFIQRRIVKRKFTSMELEKLPLKHHARTNPDLEVDRREILTLDMPPFGTVANREDVIFSGKEPIKKTEEN